MNRLSRICALALASACSALPLPPAAASPRPPAARPGALRPLRLRPLAPGSASGSASASSGEAGDAMSEGQRYAYAIRDARPAEDAGIPKSSAATLAGPDAGCKPQQCVGGGRRRRHQMMLDTMGIDAATLDAYAFSMSMMNVRAYAIGVFKPAEGQAEAVQAAVENYVPDCGARRLKPICPTSMRSPRARSSRRCQRRIALVMSEGAADIMASLEKTLK